MTYLELANLVCRKAISSKMFNFAMEGNVYDINPLTVKDYPLFLLTAQGPHKRTKNTMQFVVTFFYFDRLASDNSNSTQVYSTGIEAIANLINGLKTDSNILSISDEVDYIPFLSSEAQVLNDRCCGVYATLTITTRNNTTCYID